MVSFESQLILSSVCYNLIKSAHYFGYITQSVICYFGYIMQSIICCIGYVTQSIICYFGYITQSITCYLVILHKV